MGRRWKAINAAHPGVVPAGILFAVAVAAPGLTHAQAASSLPSAPTPASMSGTMSASMSATSSAMSSAPSGASALAGSPQTAATASSTNGPAANSAQQPAQGSVGGGYPVQVPTESSLFNAYLGSVQSQPAVPRVIPLTLDDALHRGIENNLGLVYSRQAAERNHAMRLQDLNTLLPNIDVQGTRALRQVNLEAQGFRPGVLSSFSSLFGSGGGAGSTASFPLIVKVNTVQAQANVSQYLFDWAGYDLVKALGHLVKSADQTAQSSRGLVVTNVGTAYLRVIAAQSQVAYDQALLKTDATVAYQTHQEHLAGVVANLDDLRARVQLQTEEQALAQDQDTLAKARIALNRSIGLAPEQETSVQPATPFPELDGMAPEAAVREALAQRQDYQSAMEQLKAAEAERRAATHERFPTLQFNGDYGVIGIVGGNYRGTFSAVGTLAIPIFQEARFRSDRDLAQFQIDNARAQLANLRGQIGQQVRDTLIDLKAASDTVTVARSNAQLAQVALQQASERFRAGVEDNLSTIDASSTLAAADVQEVNAEFQLNRVRLELAQSLGLIDVNFHPEWKGGHPAGVTNDQIAMGRFVQ